MIDVSGGSHTLYESIAFGSFKEIHIPDGTRSDAKFVLPDGTTIRINHDDTITVDDSNAKILYKSNPVRDFNPYLNTSDMLEDFIHWCAEQKITKDDFSTLPVSLFICWLVVKAAEADGEELADVTPMLTSAVRERKLHNHRCRCCGRFLSKKYESHQISFCSPEHMTKYMEKL